MHIKLSDHTFSGNVTADTGSYDVHLSWFIDMQQYQLSAHGEMFCVQCHSDIGEKSVHPKAANVSRDASEFFDKSHCGDSDCHANTLTDYEKGIHGRIRFQNQEKFANCIGCHDPHATAFPGPGNRPRTQKGRDLCQPGKPNRTSPLNADWMRNVLIATTCRPQTEPISPGGRPISAFIAMTNPAVSQDRKRFLICRSLIGQHMLQPPMPKIAALTVIFNPLPTDTKTLSNRVSNVIRPMMKPRFMMPIRLLTVKHAICRATYKRT